MSQNRTTGTWRFAASALIALPITVALIFLMTRLILPGEDDRIVSRMIQNIEYQRTIRPPEPANILVYQLPQAIEERPPTIEPTLIVERSRPARSSDSPPDESADQNDRVRVIDWWAEARRLTQESGDEAFKRWLLEQGYDRYVTIMQGPLPITNSVQGKLPPSQEDATGYMNSFGDMEYRISENCVATTQVAARLDHSDFAKALPMRITCKAPAKKRVTFDRNDRK